MANLIIEKISDTKIWIHDGSTTLMELDTSDGVTIRSSLRIGSDLISPSSAELAAINGMTVTATELNLLAQGVAGGYKIARSASPVALDGSNPTSVAHGLTTCVAAFAQLTGSVAPGASTSVLSVVINGANLDVYGWKPTTGGVAGNPTLIASDGTESFSWFAVGV